MNTSRIERVVTAVLQADAEDAMNTTDTNTQLQRMVHEAHREARQRRIRWTSGGLLVAAAAVVAAVVLWWPGDDDADTSPARLDEEQSSAEALATEFVEAYAAFDRDLMASYLADDADITLFGDQANAELLMLNNRADEATDFRSSPEPCSETSRDAEGVRVECPFSFHVLHSEELGRGPFGDCQWDLVVRDGEMVSVSASSPVETNGFNDEHYLPFQSWMEATHPVEAVILDDWQSPLAYEALVDRSLREWELRAREYADAVLAGEAE